ncbi:MAG TPA: PAS domain S-box protein, partial [Phycisphaerae bacterium]|nr:PAS domain S-box protein [Phycisphaerae bacterium]
AMLVLRAMDWQGAAYESPRLLIALNFVFSLLASLLVAYLIGRSFLARGTPGLLMLGCGVMIWGAAALVGIAAGIGRSSPAGPDINVAVTIHNTGVWLSALCHLTGAVISLRPGRALRAPGVWLAAAYTGALAAVGLVTLSAHSGLLPVFFIQGQGGTSVRYFTLGSAVAMFVLTAVLLGSGRRPLSAFRYWYALALALLAAGLFGIMIETVHAGLLSWTGRAAQFLSGAYMLVAAMASVRETGVQGIRLDAARWGRRRAVWDERLVQFLTPKHLWSLPRAWRYPLAVVIAVAATFLRWVLIPWIGTIAPYNIALVATVVTTLLLGIGPGLLSVLLCDVPVELFITGSLRQTIDPTALARLAVSMAVGVFVACILHAIRVAQIKARRSEARFAAFAAATFEGVAESQAGRILDCNEQFAKMLGRTAAELKGMAIAELIAPEDRGRVLANIRENRESTTEHAMLRKDGTRIIIEAHGRPVAPGSARRHTAIRDITERKRAEAVQQTTVQRFYSVLSTMHSGVLLVTDEGRVEFANQAFCDSFGLKDAPADLVGLAAPAVVAKIRDAYVDPDAAVARIREILDRGQPVRDEEVAMRGGGMCLRSFVPLSAHGKSYGRLWLHFDITKRKRAEQALRESEEHYRSLFDNMLNGFAYCKMIFDQGRPADFVYLEVNQAFETLTGLKDVIGKRVSEVIPGIRESDPRLFELYGRVALTGKSERCETYVSSLDAWFSVSVYCPQREHFVAVFDVITERKRAEETLRQAHERLALAQQSAGAGMWDWDLTTEKLEWSPEMFRLFGLDPAQAHATFDTWRASVHPEDRRIAEERIERSLEDRMPLASEYRIVLPGGQVRWINAMGQAVYDEAGRPLRMSGICLDINDRKHAEQQLQQANAELEQKNAEMEQLVYTVSHDLKSPLVTIQGFLSYLGQDAESGRMDRLTDHLRRIQNASSRMARLNNELLDISRIGRLANEPTPINLTDLAREVVAAHAEKLAEGRIKVDIQADMPVILGDSQRIHQVFDNLLVNAIKYGSDAADPRIELGAMQEGDEVRAFVRDNGKGIPPEFHDKIFKLFHRLDHDKDGVGVGLAIVKRIAEVHGGRVWVESPPGEGATFWVSFRAEGQCGA